MARPNLRIVPDDRPPRRLIAIVRVSKLGGRGDDLVSPDIQREAITSHLDRTGGVIARWVEAIDESGSRARSSWWGRLDSAIEEIEAGDADGIVAWKFSRVARHRRRWAVAVDRIEAARGTVESATEGVDTTTSTGKLARGMLAEINAYYSDQLSEGWKEVQARRVAAGIPHAGKLPWGWRWEGRTVVADPERAPYVVAAYDRFMGGASANEIARWLNGIGMVPDQSGHWHNARIRDWLDSPIHAGLITYQGQLHPGAHEGLISVEEWEEYRASRRGERRRNRAFLLSGIAQHHHCGGMSGTTNSQQYRQDGTPRARHVSYICRAMVQADKATRTAHGPWSLSGRIIDAALMDFLRELAADVDNVQVTRAIETDRTHIEARRIDKELIEVKNKLATLTERWLDEKITEAAYTVTAERLEQRRATLLEGQAAAAARPRRIIPADPSAVARGLLADWDTLTVERCRAVVRDLVARIDCDPRERTARVVPVWSPKA